MQSRIGILKISLGNLSHKWGWVLALGIALCALGIFGIIESLMLTVVSVLFLGIIVFIAGIGILLNAIFHGHGWKGRLVSCLTGLLYIGCGGIIAMTPLSSAAWLTMLLCCFLVVSGFFRIISGFQHRQMKGSSWAIIGGLITAACGAILLFSWPLSGLWVIGFMVGFQLLVDGINAIFIAVAAKEIRESSTFSHPQVSQHSSQ